MHCAKQHATGRAFIALGSNLDNPQAQLLKAFEDIHALPQTRVLARSALYRSAPVGYADQPDFVNAVAEIETALAPHELLEALLEIERQRGRNRTFRNAPRVLDLDVLLYDDLVCHDEGLTLPHPRMHERAFVLQPLLEIAPHCVIPGRGVAADYVAQCSDQTLQRLQPNNIIKGASKKHVVG